MIKKCIVLAALVAGLMACNNNETKSTTAQADSAAKANQPGEPAAGDISKNPDYQKGLALITSNDCLTCHKIDETVTGPAYRDVANKYPDNEQTIDMLSNKVIKGGSGNWGSVPMTPHDQLSKDDAKAMVKYILLLKTKS